MAGLVPAVTEIVERSAPPTRKSEAMLARVPHPNSGVPGTKASKAAQNWVR